MFERYKTACVRIFREAEALASADASMRADGAVASGRGVLRIVV
jgi:hypothetical protein